MVSAPHDTFLTDDFLLESEFGRRLYHEYAERLPILDYHTHLSPGEIALDQRFDNLTQIWLAGDHYKWRVMRACGVNEHYITGDAPERDKFDKWAETVPKLLRNPLYHWTHMELKRPLGIADRLLNSDTAPSIWEECNEKLSLPEFSCRGLLQQMNVRVVCTTDDPVDSLEHHQAIAADASFDVRVLPTWRPDKGINVEDPTVFNAWVDRLAQAADIEIRDFESYLEALRRRHDHFSSVGCCLSDHGLDRMYAEDFTRSQVRQVFSKIRSGQSLDAQEVAQFKSAMLYELALLDHEKGWVQQFHLGALRSCSTRIVGLAGVDSGSDSMGDLEMARPLARFFDRLDQNNQLCRTILYNLNPRDNALFATMVGNFQDGETPGKMQYGSAWWFLDTIDGMTEQIETLSNMGVLSQFVGMLTDSRSFLSFPRHDYFRRLLCNILGHDMRRGLIPSDMDLVGQMIQDICYFNANRYFGFQIP